MRTSVTIAALAAFAGCGFAAVPAHAQAFVAKMSGEQEFVRGSAFACHSEREATIVLASPSNDTSFVLGFGAAQLAPGTVPVGREGVRVVYMSSKAGIINPDGGYVTLDSIRDRVVHGKLAMMYGDSALGVAAFRAEYLGMWPDNDPKRFWARQIDGRFRCVLPIAQAHSRPMPKKDSIALFFASYPAGITELAASLRTLVRSAIPDASETLDESGRVVGYGVGSGYSGLVCTIIPSKSGVKLGIVRGAELPDPHGLLEGNGKRHRYVQLSQPADLHRVGIKELLRAAREIAEAT